MNEERNKKRLEIISIIAALFIFQYSLLIPVMHYVRASLLVGASGIVLVIAMIIVNNRLTIDQPSLIVLIALTALMTLKMFIDGTDAKILINFLMIAIPPIVVFSYRFDMGTFLRWGYRLSIANFVVLCWTPFFGPEVSYMRFGYGMLLTVIFMYLGLVYFPKKNPEEDLEKAENITVSKYIKTKKHVKKSKAARKRTATIVFRVVLLALSGVETLIYGSRGAMFVILAFVALDRLLINKGKFLSNAALLIAGFVAIFNLDKILQLFIDLGKRLNANTYSLRKYQYQLKYGLEEASSGRTHLYSAALKTIGQNPLLGAKMIIYDSDTLYVHNLFLQVGRDLGIVPMLFSVLFVVFCLYIFWSDKYKTDEKIVSLLLFSVSVVRLMISSNVWERPEFWAELCFVFVLWRQRREETEPETEEESPILKRAREFIR